MDIINGYSVIVARDEKTAKLISNAVGLKFDDLKTKTNELVSRKEIVKGECELHYVCVDNETWQKNIIERNKKIDEVKGI